MFRVITLSGVLTAALAQPAAALWIEHADGTFTDIPDGIVFCVLVVVVVAGIASFASTSSTSSADEEVNAAELARQYDDEAAQYRAMSRKLDAETDLAESLIKAKRTRAELDDIESIFKDHKSRRR